nr:MAG TPA: hypothetical protein [Caudoviricetes sp.]
MFAHNFPKDNAEHLLLVQDQPFSFPFAASSAASSIFSNMACVAGSSILYLSNIACPCDSRSASSGVLGFSFCSLSPVSSSTVMPRACATGSSIFSGMSLLFARISARYPRLFPI